MTDSKIKANKSNLPHDAFFKRIMENQLSAKNFLKQYLPDNVKNIVDLNTIEVQKESYIESNLTKRFSDIVYKIKTIENNDAFIYVIAEHQSSVDHTMVFRLWKYLMLVAERHIGKDKKIPLIFPIVVYNGKAKYTAPRVLWELFDDPKLAKLILNEDHALVDLQAATDDEIAKNENLALYEYILKHNYMKDKLELLKNLLKKFSKLINLDREEGYFYINNILCYIDNRIPFNKKDELNSLLLEHLPKEDSEDIMRTIADSYREEGINTGFLQGIEKGREEGIEKGREEGIMNTARNMLKEGIDNQLVTRVTNLPIEQIIKIKESL